MERKVNRGNTDAMFMLKDKVIGRKTIDQEPVAIKDPENGNTVTDPNKIKDVTLLYCYNLLQNREPSESYFLVNQLKKTLHSIRMKEEIVDDVKFSEELFNKAINNIAKKNNGKYDFIIKTGKSYQMAVFNLFQPVWNMERKPEQ